jgi:outer membrane phospholipase A
MSERSEIKRMNAVGHKNSGRGKYQKADASWRNFVVDIKEYKNSFSLTKDVWAKIVTDTLKTNKSKLPALKVILGDEQKIRLAVIEWSVLEELERLAYGDDN